MRRVTLLSVILLAFATLGACGSDATGSPPAGPLGSGVPRATDPPAAPEVEGRSFVSTSVTENGKPRPLVTGTQIHVSFRAGRLSVSGGCNSSSGPYFFEGTTLRVREMMSTLIGCPGEREQQDGWLSAIFGSGPTVTLDGDRLTVKTADTTIELLDVKVADPDRPLAGTTWTLHSIISGQTASSGTSMERPTLVLGDDGSVRYTANCEKGAGTYTIENDVITFVSVEPEVAPDPSCPADEAKTDAAIRQLLSGSAGFTIDGPILKLNQGDHGIWWSAKQ